MDEARSAFCEQMDDDFNTAGAIGELNKFNKQVRGLLDGGERLNGAALAALDGVYITLGEGVLGILRDVGQTGRESGGGMETELIDSMIETRAALREAGQYELADDIRDRLSELGIELHDDPEGTRWEFSG